MKIGNIKFKAKRLDGKGWVKGSLLRSTAGIKERAYIVDNFSSMSDYSVIGVDPSTVCQFTGMRDCEGKEIWEDDMLSNVTNDSPDGMVVFKYGAFCLLAKNGRDFCVALTYLLSKKDSLNRFKVIGNKFDKK